MIEPLIHQIWFPFSSPEIPASWRRFAQSWRRWHPHHRYELWGPERARSFVQAHHPDFLVTYDAYREPIQRVDALRCLLLAHFGGIYADLDVECLRNVEPLLEGQRVVLAAEPARHAEAWHRHRTVISSAFMATEARHAFWAAVKTELQRCAHREEVMESTGPFVITRVYERHPERLAITVLPPERIYPVDQLECADLTAYDLEHWLEATRDAHCVHHWAGTWKDPGSLTQRARRPYPHGVPVKVRLPEAAQAAELRMRGPTVSCIMVSRGWKEPARWSVECFRNQTYEDRELLVVTTNAEGDLADHLASLNDPRIRLVGVFPAGTTIGALRNLAVDHAQGDLICTWDDDDLFGADRLAAGVTALTTTGAAAAFLERITMWWPARRELAISARHPWENTMIARRKVLPRYRDVDREEDSEAMQLLRSRYPVVTIDDPNLFVYCVTGGNTWGPDHFGSFFERSTFAARGPNYERGLSVLEKHVPILKYLEWLQARDPRTFEPSPMATVGRPLPSPLPEDRHSAAAGRIVTAPRSTLERAMPPLRFLFAWELGGGLGHTVPLSQVARPLLEAGHMVDMVLCDLSTARAAMGRLVDHPGLRVWQAPTWPAQPIPFPESASYAELLFRAGYLEADRLAGLVDAWNSLFLDIRPELLLADHAPTAMLAAQGHDFARATIGTGFFELIPESPIPSFRDWEPIPRSRLEEAERRVLGTCNAILAARSLPCLSQLHELSSADEHFLLTVPELDHFERRSRDPAQRYHGFMHPPSHGKPVTWPRGTEPAVFAYLKADYPALPAVLEALKASPWRVIAYVAGWAGRSAELLTSATTARMSIVREPVDMVEITRTCQAVVCHSGSGTTTSALSAGKPLVMLPSNLEQYLVGRRIQGMGAGLVVVEDRVEQLPGAIRRVVENASYREAAEAFARRYDTAQGGRVAETVAARCHQLAILTRRRRAGVER